jgi:hypothetical protein
LRLPDVNYGPAPKMVRKKHRIYNWNECNNTPISEVAHFGALWRAPPRLQRDEARLACAPPTTFSNFGAPADFSNTSRGPAPASYAGISSIINAESPFSPRI